MIVFTVIATLLALGCAIVFTLIGLHVTRKYPMLDDPRRALKRYTLPAALAVLVAILAVIAALVGLMLTLAGY